MLIILLQQLNNAKVNKRQFNTFSIVVLILVLFTSSLTFAQNAKITGKVVDKANGETLIGLAVGIEGSTKGTLTDVEGRFTLTGLTAGKYNLTFRYLGYQAKTITAVEVKAGQVTTLDVQMEQSATQALKEVVVTASYKQETVGALYAKQKNNISISNGISSDQIKKSPDRNTSEVLKRVSGASIQDNKFVVIRGLSDRYNSTLLNGAVLPSTEPDKKAFSFDIIPSNLIDNLIISKTASPELPGEFAGGVIQVVTKDIPDQNYISLSVGAGYNTQSTFKDFNLGEKKNGEFLGFVNSERNIPQGVPKTIAFRTAGAQEKINAGKLFDNSFNTKSSKGVPSQNYQLNLGLQKSFENDGKLGLIFSLSQRNGESISNSERYDYESNYKQFDFNDRIFKYSTSSGALLNLAYVKGNNKIALKNLYNISLDNSYTSRYGVQIAEQDSIRGNSLDLVSKSLLNNQLEGDHKLNWKDVKVNWNMNYSYTERNQPDLKSLNYRLDYDQGATKYEAIVPNGTASRTDASRFFSNMTEDSYGGALNFTIPFNLFNEKSSAKLGFLKQYKLRDFAARKFGYIRSSYGTFDQNLLYLPMDKIFEGQNLNLNGFIMDEGTENADKYDATSDLNAGYIQFDNKIGSKTRVIWGVRLEDSYQLVNTFDPSGNKLKVENTYLDVLPSLNLTYSLNDKTNIRIAASQTVTRPELREMSRFGFFDYISKRILQGNPDLKRSQNTNLDFKYEIYPSNGQILSFSAFYKNFQNPIEQIVSSGNGGKNVSFQNANSANTYGFEIEARKNLEFLGNKDFLKNLTIYTNASFIISTVNLNSLVSEVTSRALQGQSPYLLNAGLQYASPKNDMAFSLLYNKIGPRIAEVGYEGYADIYERGRDMLDFQISKNFSKRFELKLNVSDILNQKQIFYQNNDSKKTYDASKDNLMNAVKYGSGISLSLKYDLSLGK
ncbi:TonB-dependent receptor [Pseudopedobacter saltans DSM 12145]|uniref:TonB-dependent receptor n=1 Tax=Pseudopedobacter saltans (strain ATCC 51119 / DSM 12145 / JCM 21818 / CCUG 39354 / LMG 10337 / NBRC 100064 / NCIMB 13643) TaxID=762903 RepID=F0S751_PSESL|nr:TonB-dependent receptor [Pseudopedobacter saltans]ADY54324.1 TonB-dependent receptor [Pseudopedobacter saltans DSM 12145]